MGFELVIRTTVFEFYDFHAYPCRPVAKCALWFGISNAMIPVCDAPCHSALRGSFANPFANFVTPPNQTSTKSGHMCAFGGASASVGALFAVSFPLGDQASGKDDGEQPKWTTTSSMFQTG